MRKKIILIVLVVGVGALALAVLLPPRYHAKEAKLPASFDEFYQNKLKQSAELKARPGNEERLIRFADKTDYAILYIHGYGASRAEGELVVDQIANKFKFNTYYMRLPGHGTNVEDQAKTTFSDLINGVEETYSMMHLLGNKVIIIGTSMGGLLTTYLASRHPEIDAIVLASPFYDFKDSRVRLANEPGMMKVLEMVNGGPVRKSTFDPNDPTETNIDGYQAYWYQNQYLEALRALEDLREYAANKATFEQVTEPVLMLYYYKDEEHQDGTASVPLMLQAFSEFGTAAGKKPNPLNRAVAIENGDHVLLSQWVKADHERSYQEIIRFIEDVQKAGTSK